jgi:hypothetical protein
MTSPPCATFSAAISSAGLDTKTPDALEVGEERRERAAGPVDPPAGGNALANDEPLAAIANETTKAVANVQLRAGSGLTLPIEKFMSGPLSERVN